MGIGGGGQALPERKAGGAGVGVEFGDQRLILVGRGQDGDERMVLGRRADHGRAADVDVLDDLVAGAAAGHGLGEGVEVDDGEVDGADAVRGHGGLVFGIVPHAEQPAMDDGVQGLDPAIQHLRAAGQLRHVLDLVAHGPQRRGGAAGGDQLHAMADKRRRQRVQPGLVRYRQEGTAHNHMIRHRKSFTKTTVGQPASGSSRRWRRLSRSGRKSPAGSSCAIGPRDQPTSLARWTRCRRAPSSATAGHWAA